MSNWLVTGGCGFIGSHLVDALLARGDRVRVVDDLSSGKRGNIPDEVEVIVGDIADRSIIESAIAGVDGIFHLAAIASVRRSINEWVACHRTNLTGSINVFDCARPRQGRAAVPVVYASSAAVYGDNTAVPLRETSALQPISAYGADKLGSELHGRVAWTVHGVPNTGLRFFNVYGPRQDPSSPYSGVIAIFADRTARNSEIEIFGDGGQTRDFIFVGDVVAHLTAAMATVVPGARVLNVCTGRGTTIRELAECIAGIAGRKAQIRHGPARPGDIRASVGDPGLARQTFGLEARTNLVDGLRRTLRFAAVTSGAAGLAG